MIFVSSSCVDNKLIKDSVKELAEEGFVNIEISGGTDYYNGYLDDLFELKEEYQLRYQIHNYFPPPQYGHFMLNLSSLNDEIYEKSLEHYEKAIKLCKILGGKKYGIHAGFLIDLLPDDAGKKIKIKSLSDRNNALERFHNALSFLKNVSSDDVELYIENNVFSKSNVVTYGQDNPFLFTDYQSWLELSELVECRPLLDFAHLKVSCASLGLSFNEQVRLLVGLTDYYHISGNDGLHDLNCSIIYDQDILQVLESYDWIEKIFTIEVYEGMDSIHESFDLLQSMIA